MIDIAALDFVKSGGLLPVIVQDATTRQVLMLGYMNQEAVEKTLAERRVTFYSRSKERLWTKGETSGHYLDLVSIAADCDQDALLIQAHPHGPVCHTGTGTCWGEENKAADFLTHLEGVIQQRRDHPSDTSYTTSLFQKGINKVAQKVGEEAVELVIEAKDDNADLFLNEAADLTYHLLVLLAAKGHTLAEVIAVLRSREK